MNSQRDIELWGAVITIFNHWVENNSWFVVLQFYIVSGGLDGFRLKGLEDRSLEDSFFTSSIRGIGMLSF